MSRRLCSARSNSRRSGGFTLAEVLVGLTIAAMVIAGVGGAVIFATRAWSDNQARLQAQQSLRWASEALSRETRLAGACMLPYSTGTAPPANFQPLSGAHSGTTDTMIVRTNPNCAQATTTTPCNQCNGLHVDNTTNFSAGGWAYLLNASAGLNQYFQVNTVTGGQLHVSVSTPITANFPTGTSVFGVEQRTFSISSACTGCGGVPTLTVQTLTIPQGPLSKGIDALQISYVLNRTYDNTTCTASTGGTPNLCIVTLPGTAPSIAGDWQIVREVLYTIDARSSNPVRASGSPDGFFHLGGTLTITPRNFTFVQGGRL